MDQQNSQPLNNSEIDLIRLFGKLWEVRIFVLKASVISVLVGLVVAFSIPKEYLTEVKLSPEISLDNSSLGNMSELASMAGISLNNTVGREALFPELYPDIVSSTPFLLELANIRVETIDSSLETSFYDYMKEYQSQAWWEYVIHAPFDFLKWAISSLRNDIVDENNDINPFRLTKKQEEYLKKIKKKIAVNVDKKSGVIKVSVLMQDPLISAILMDTVLTKLQAYVIDYRTRKAKHDLAFSEKLFDEARSSYYKTQQAYAYYVDENRNVISASYRTEEERLRNEMNLSYGVYNQMAKQLEMNKIKVQEVTPVYTVIEPARVAVKAVKPNKPLILIVFLFLAVFVSCCIILGREIFANFKDINVGD